MEAGVDSTCAPGTHLQGRNTALPAGTRRTHASELLSLPAWEAGSLIPLLLIQHSSYLPKTTQTVSVE